MTLSASPSAASRVPHLPALDGLRGLALLGVLLFHSGGILKGGYLGVDLFFVLSGYLITALLVAEFRDTGSIDFWAFWVRRARRLLPVVLTLMLAIAVYAHWFAEFSELVDLRWDALATLGYVANWRAIATDSAYWDLFSAPSPLDHTWSLAIEEQFYVVWPVLVFWLLSRRGIQHLRGFTLAAAALSMGAMTALYDPAHTSRVYLGTDTRATGILLGAALATVLRPGQSLPHAAMQRLDVFGLAALAGTAVAWVALPGDHWLLYRGGFWATELFGLLLIACAATGRGRAARLLAWAPLRGLGKVSYGAYLWHWPVNVVLSQQRLPLAGWPLLLLQWGVTFIIAVLSYRYLEQPIRRRGVPFGKPLWVVPAATGLSLAAVLGATGPLTTGGGPDPDAFRLLLVGDSTANSLGWSLRELRRRDVAVELAGNDGLNLLLEDPAWAPWSEHVRGRKAEATLVLLGGAFLYGLDADGDWRDACYPAWNARFELGLAARLRDLKSAQGERWVSTVPYALEPHDGEQVRRRIDCINASVRKVATLAGGIRLLDLAEIQCPHEQCLVDYRGRKMRPDGVHYKPSAARPIAEQVLNVVLATRSAAADP